MPSLKDRLAWLKQDISEVPPSSALARIEQGALLVDIREAEEIAAGTPVGARIVRRGYLEMRIGELAPDFDQPLLVLCGNGTRSLFAADSLKQLGYHDAHSVAGGFQRWRTDGLPYEVPRMFDVYGSIHRVEGQVRVAS